MYVRLAMLRFFGSDGWLVCADRCRLDRHVASPFPTPGKGGVDEECLQSSCARWIVPDLGTHPARERNASPVAGPFCRITKGICRGNGSRISSNGESHATSRFS